MFSKSQNFDVNVGEARLQKTLRRRHSFKFVVKSWRMLGVGFMTHMFEAGANEEMTGATSKTSKNKD